MAVVDTKGRSCAGKRAHGSDKAAEKHRQRLVRRGGTASWRVHTYRCGHCDGWHVGHKPTPRKRR